MLRSAQHLSTEEGAFHPCPRDKITVRGLIEAAQRKSNDAVLDKNSLDTRVEANYDACFNLALAVLNAHGWKPKAIAEHHEFTLEAACSIVGATQSLFDRVDAIRQVRNLKYTGVSRTQRDVDYARQVLTEFSSLAIEWLGKNHPALLQP